MSKEVHGRVLGRYLKVVLCRTSHNEEFLSISAFIRQCRTANGDDIDRLGIPLLSRERTKYHKAPTTSL